MSATTSNVIAPPVIPSPASGRARLLWLLSGLGIAGLAVLYFFNPIEYAFYPACQFYKLTHLHCPGCGSLRAMHQLTHGHFIAAFLSNPLLIASIPIFAWIGFRKLRLSPDHSANQTLIKPAAVWTMLVIVIVFGILRNLPFAAFSWMSP